MDNTVTIEQDWPCKHPEHIEYQEAKENKECWIKCVESKYFNKSTGYSDSKDITQQPVSGNKPC